MVTDNNKVNLYTAPKSKKSLGAGMTLQWHDSETTQFRHLITGNVHKITTNYIPNISLMDTFLQTKTSYRKVGNKCNNASSINYLKLIPKKSRPKENF